MYSAKSSAIVFNMMWLCCRSQFFALMLLQFLDSCNSLIYNTHMLNVALAELT